MKPETETKLKELEAEYTRLLAQKDSEQAKMLRIKNMIRTSGTMPALKYKACVASQETHLHRINVILVKMREVKFEIKRINRENFTEKNCFYTGNSQ